MFLIIYDHELQRITINWIRRTMETIKPLYEAFKKWSEQIYLLNQDIPAKFASRIFLGEGFWDYTFEVRVVPALFQILIDILKLPIWISWADLELGSDMVRIIYVFSEASKVEGIPGRVIIAQFSDDDREVELAINDERIRISTLLAGIGLLMVIKKFYLNKDVDMKETVTEFNERVKSILEEIKGEKERATDKEEITLTDLEEELKKDLGELVEY